MKTAPLSSGISPSPLERAGVRRDEATIFSIIIPARNEEQNILNCFASIYKQTYPSTGFEVIVVDDHSTDKTAVLVAAQKHSNLKLIRLSADQTGKKQAITEGIKNASGDFIITTDADCEMGPEWLSSIILFYQEKRPKMVVGPVLIKGESSFQETMQAQEMTVLSACAAGSIYYNLPILCSGANLSFEKSAFTKVNGFDGVEQTATGDDMFLMLKIHSEFPGSIAYLKSKEAIVFTHPEKLASDALKQRKRWASKTFSYPKRGASSQRRHGLSHVTWVAILIFFTNFLILFSGIISIINIKFVLVPAVCFSSKFIVDLMLLYSASSFFGKKMNPFVFAAASVMYPVYVSGMGLISPFTNYTWKSRRS